MEKMKVEIWSDVMCPWCYIGKRRFESALKQFEHRDRIEVVWKSFQLNPGLETDPSKNINQYLAEIKGWSLEKAGEMNDYVTGLAAKEGLEYNFDKAIVANSFDAHRVVQLAKTRGLGDVMEERLFRAYFTEGKNTADHQVLAELATGVGLQRDEVEAVLKSDAFANEVRGDIREASQLGIRGVPFYVLDRQYGVSGARESGDFHKALVQAFEGWQKEHPLLKMDTGNGEACTPEGECK